MSQPLTLDVPDEVYQSLAAEAASTGKTLEQVAGGRLSGPPPLGPLISRWAGTADSGLPDLASRVDEYVGRAAAGGGQ